MEYYTVLEHCPVDEKNLQVQLFDAKGYYCETRDKKTRRIYFTGNSKLKIVLNKSHAVTRGKYDIYKLCATMLRIYRGGIVFLDHDWISLSTILGSAHCTAEILAIIFFQTLTLMETFHRSNCTMGNWTTDSFVGIPSDGGLMRIAAWNLASVVHGPDTLVPRYRRLHHKLAAYVTNVAKREFVCAGGYLRKVKVTLDMVPHKSVLTRVEEDYLLFYKMWHEIGVAMGATVVADITPRQYPCCAEELNSLIMVEKTDKCFYMYDLFP